MDSSSADRTEQIGALIGGRLKGGEVIELVSDVGGGKTTFVRGLARGLGSKAVVASPTFTISREYQAGELTLYHFDFYRLNEPGLMAHELAEVLQNPQAIVVVEWGDRVEDVLPPERMTINITLTSIEAREFKLTVPQTLSYLIPKSGAS